MCGGGPKYSATDAENDRKRARQEAEAQRIASDQTAQATANAAVSAARVRKRANALQTARGSMGAPSAAPALTSTVLARGAATLGGS